jgi:GDP-D-mannose dehydratase
VQANGDSKAHNDHKNAQYVEQYGFHALTIVARNHQSAGCAMGVPCRCLA